ncbi:MAG: transposase family protein [Bacillota bacterium]|nr:transposase family protein [Bacillota bacterium]
MIRDNEFYKNILNIKDDNIFFDDNCYKMDKYKGLDSHFIEATLSYDPEICPLCGKENISNSIVKNGFKPTKIRLLPISNAPAFLILKKQRFLCRQCGASFMAQTSYIEPFVSISKDLKEAILKDVKNNISLSNIARTYFVSITTVIRISREADL